MSRKNGAGSCGCCGCKSREIFGGSGATEDPYTYTVINSGLTVGDDPYSITVGASSTNGRIQSIKPIPSLPNGKTWTLDWNLRNASISPSGTTAYVSPVVWLFGGDGDAYWYGDDYPGGEFKVWLKTEYKPVKVKPWAWVHGTYAGGYQASPPFGPITDEQYYESYPPIDQDIGLYLTVGESGEDWIDAADAHSYQVRLQKTTVYLETPDGQVNEFVHATYHTQLYIVDDDLNLLKRDIGSLPTTYTTAANEGEAVFMEWQWINPYAQMPIAPPRQLIIDRRNDKLRIFLANDTLTFTENDDVKILAFEIDIADSELAGRNWGFEHRAESTRDVATHRLYLAGGEESDEVVAAEDNQSGRNCGLCSVAHPNASYPVITIEHSGIASFTQTSTTINTIWRGPPSTNDLGTPTFDVIVSDVPASPIVTSPAEDMICLYPNRIKLGTWSWEHTIPGHSPYPEFVGRMLPLPINCYLSIPFYTIENIAGEDWLVEGDADMAKTNWRTMQSPLSAITHYPFFHRNVTSGDTLRHLTVGVPFGANYQLWDMIEIFYWPFVSFSESSGVLSSPNSDVGVYRSGSGLLRPNPLSEATATITFDPL
jgi:hypothetical protein